METKRELEQSQRDAISERYPVDDEDPISRISEAPIVARVGALAVLHAVGDRAGLIYPIEFHNSTIAPSNTFSEQLFVDAWHFNLLHVHPTSPTDAFVWDDGTTLGTTLGTSIYPEQTRFFVPGMGTLENRLETFVHCLRDGLDLSAMWSYDRPELSDLVHKVIAEEAGRYLAYQLRQHNLPDRTDRHNEVLRTVTTRGASLFSLGHLYRMAWSSARDASSAKQRHPSMSTENAITHGLNQFEQRIQKASYDRGSLNEPFSEDNNLPLTSVTDIVFRIILGMDPMSSEPAHIADMLSAAPDDELRALCEAGIPSHRELMERIRTSTDEWDGYEFRRILARLEQQPPDACAPRCAHDRLTDVASEGGQVYDRIVSRVGEADAAIVTAEATSLANAGHNGLRADDALLSAVVHLLLPLTDLEPAILAEQE
ncbi:hypothetical protein MLGJGCBP_03549 [Rhodococcus sp. T7]|nr:hypothetical protein MLGJGCBP_09517 [Rhodococcus sp. T7]KAF0963243.1 hypothetical protein MLGJGCBP_03549 [Rhodococcus sp. T7]